MTDDYQEEVIRVAGFVALTLTSWHPKVPEADSLHGPCLTGAKLTTGNYWFYRFAESAKNSICGCPLLSGEEEFVTDDYLRDSVIRHYSTQKSLLIQIFRIYFSHTDRTLTHL